MVVPIRADLFRTCLVRPQPVVVRSYPGEIAKLDLWKPSDADVDRGFTSYGDYVHFRDLEFMMSDPASRISTTSGSGSVGISGRSGQINVKGDENKFINNIIHDLSSCVWILGRRCGRRTVR
ncbi:MAG: hypothetical protein R3C28_26455 [Pirellulaceae bacterium]